MTAIAIFGETEASEKLVRASLSDILDTHLKFSGDEPFDLVLSGRTDTLSAIQAWASEAQLPIHSVHSTPTPKEAVALVWGMAKSKARVLALIGDNEPTGDVAHALVKAAAHGIDIRDLAEAGITYVQQVGDVPTTTDKEPAVAAEEEEELTWAEIGEIADDPDHESQEEAEAMLREAAEALDIDPDTYETWALVAEDVQAEEDSQESGEPEDEPDEPAVEDDPVAEATGIFHQADFKGKSLKEVRDLARQSGIADAAKLGRDDLINTLCGINVPEAGDEVVEDAPVVASLPTSDPTDFPPAVIDAIANAVANKIAERLAYFSS